jgi:ribosomal protein S18 acetylase RimI-like enzyme
VRCRYSWKHNHPVNTQRFDRPGSFLDHAAPYLETQEAVNNLFLGVLVRLAAEHYEEKAFMASVQRDGLIGLAIVGFQPLEGPKIAHKGVLWGMYVRPEARGTGLATALVGSLIEHAREHVEQIQLTVVSNNPRARRFYQRMGFSEYGLEKKALKYNGVYFDEVLMVRFLNDGR